MPEVGAGQRNVLVEGAVRAVATGELNRSTSAVLESVSDGERIVVTGHGRPRAVVLSVCDAIELLVAPALDQLAADAYRDYEAGETIQPWPQMHPLNSPAPLRIMLARAAADAFARLVPQDRGGLRRVVLRLTDEESEDRRGDGSQPELVWVPSKRRIAPVSFPESGVTLVHDLIEVRPLERLLIGEEIWHARRRIHHDRYLHGRAPPGAPPLGPWP